MLNEINEESLKNSTNAKCQEDWMYLESIRGSKRLGTLGNIDSHDLKRIKRKRVREEKMRKERSVSNTKYLASEFTQSFSSSEEIDIDDTEFKMGYIRNHPHIIRDLLLIMQKESH